MNPNDKNPFGEQGKWIKGDDFCEAPMFRKEFHIADCRKAVIRICGLGFFELYVNGNKVSDDLLTPVWSNYEKRDYKNMLYPFTDEMTQYRTYYCEYDFTDYIKSGENVIGVLLGNGWYHQVRRVVEGELAYGFPKLCFVAKLTNTAGKCFTIASDTNMKWVESEIIENNIYYGEKHDLRRSLNGWSEPGFDQRGWKPVSLAPSPNTHLVLQSCKADKIIDSLPVSRVYEESGRVIYDCGEVTTGYVHMICTGKEGSLVRVRHSEELSQNKRCLNFDSTGGEQQIQMDEYICTGEPLEVHPHFSWHGFRYFEVEGDGVPLNVKVVHSDIAISSEFECSNPTLNWIYQTYLRTQLTNYHCGVPSDCPHRERLGYGGDGQVTIRSALLTLDSYQLYEKWMDDIADCQDVNTGHVQHTAPFYGGGGGPGGWGGAIFLVPLAMYEYSGDKEILRKYYPNMRKWLSYMHSRTDNGLVTREEEGGWCLGEWCTPGSPLIPEAFINTYYYIYGLREVGKIAEILNIKETEPVPMEWLMESEKAFIENYYDPLTGSFCKGVNGADAFALDLGFGDERTIKVLVDKYKKSKTFDTGIFGTDLLIDILFRYNEADLAFQLLTATGETSFETMRLHGATTLWEFWDGRESHNHPMLGGIVRSFFTHILGIKQKDSFGYENVVINPHNIQGLHWAKGFIQTPKGKIKVSYEKLSDQSLSVSHNV
ncbi:family 78 glycoside hydrolase catalytic domain [Lachnospiraceae bacterium OttesenSCG-928-D06]|nr:family 78 glycoside hydrolase catalytic domain [Lachnospiraceae bacterium OttesenSCG-928-D06]